MMARVGTGWQTLLADLAIILFMITAAALSQANHEAAKKAASDLRERAKAEPAVQDMLDVFGGEIEDVEEIR